MMPLFTGVASALALAFNLFAVTPAFAVEYHPEALQAVLARAHQVRSAGQVPVALFDIDDTLLETRARTARIVVEFAQDPATRERFPEAATRLAQVGLGDIRYDIVDTLSRLGIQEPALTDALKAYWSARFFTSAYSATDIQVSGAASYVRAIHAAGAVVVYLTGRPQPMMEQGTRAALYRQRFPLNESNGSALLLMKPSADLDDLAYKKAAFDRVASIGTLIGVFENEPANLNAMHARFPSAIPVFVDTIHSNRPDLPTPDAAWIQRWSATFGSADASNR